MDSDDPAVGTSGAAERIEDHEPEELAALQTEIESLNDRHLRLAAEFDNYRKRVDRERSDLRRRSQAELAARILESLDDLQRVIAVDAAKTSAEALLDGARLVERKLRQSLESLGLQTVEAGPGTAFDPESMEAVMRVAAEDPADDDTVGDVFQPGYRFDGVLVRPAKVSVRKHE